MSVMLIFDIVIVIFGGYMIFSALRMKKTGEISSSVITKEEIAKCKDKQEFISFLYWKEALFGGVMALVGVLGIINDVVTSFGVFNVIEMFGFLAAFLWFQNALRRAREKYIY